MCDLLLGRLFHCLISAMMEDFVHGSQTITLHNPNMGKQFTLPLRLWSEGCPHYHKNKPLMQQPPIHHWNGFLDFNDPYTIWGEIHVQLFSCFSNSPSTCPSYLWSILHFNFALCSPNYNFLSSTQSALNLHTISTFSNVYTYDSVLHMLAYKPVAKKVWLVIAPMNEKYCIICSLLDNLLAGLVPLPTYPPTLPLVSVSHRNTLIH